MSARDVWPFLTKTLCAHGGSLDLRELPQHVELPESQLGRIVGDAGPGRFLLQQAGGTCQVLAVTPLRLCVRKECKGCERLHLCKLHLMGRCRVRSCKYSHDIATEENRKVLRTNDLSGLNENELRVLLLQNDPFLLPDVCPFYNRGEGNCAEQHNCTKLHICRHFLHGQCRFPNCKRSHSLLNSKALTLLTPVGVNDNAAQNIQLICDHKHATFSQEISQRKTLNNTEEARNKRKVHTGNKEKNESTETSSTPTSPSCAFSSEASTSQAAKAFSARKTARSSDVNKCNEICLFHIWKFCKHKEKCRMLHYHLPYRWQVFNGVNWNDLAKMEEIEKAYCDPNNSSLPLQNINFQKMMYAFAELRRLSTPSSVTKPPKFILTTKWIWYWKNDQGQWIEYGRQDGNPGGSSLTSDDLENLFLADPNETVDFQTGSQRYQICFKEMVQRNVLYQTQREVRRRPKFVSSEDVEKMKKGQAETPLNPNYPKDWDKSALPDTGYKAVVITKESSEYATIAKLFQQTMKGYVIHCMKRIQNPSLWQVFQWQKEQMKKNNRGKDVYERLLFHGTSSSFLESICTQNFDWRICGVHGTSYGKGSYFARDASYSHAYSQSPTTKMNMMFVARVLVGDFIRGNATYVRPPSKSTNTINLYDSCVDKESDPSIFVIFEKHQIYPEYIIEYHEDKKCTVS
ncbi:poly [ADP-ribose] polymerase 12 isoform X1 [Alligator sinensis]|uniref:Poly [ADP-ribose] polymerase 12 isoform X1 n=1 Tax=Alligator sinensis TaxID=38654 RepID=A0A1U7S9V6_ALLSI|nr:poly [ADP-ribose] polymerase 12 isoform X1 [Alligator sinensis]